MTYSNANLARHFKTGGTNGQANSMKIEEDDDGTAVLWGYGWAVYAFRTPGGNVFRFPDWGGYSQTSNRHMTLLSGPEVTDIEDVRPESIDEAIEEALATA